ncbi:MAG: hypothetical protein WD069_10985 [Planctomycetales bacterium]
MRQPPRRTNATTLTDDELLLLDVLFDGGAPSRLLRRESFAVQWNRESHDLDDDRLRETLQRFVDSGRLIVEGHGGRTHERRTWWRDVRENEKFWGESA